MGELEAIKEKSEKLPRVTDGAVAAFCHLLPRLVSLVDEKFAVENRFCCGTPLEKRMDLVRDVHARWGDVLLAVYQFGLYPALVEEFAWLVSALKHRGFDREYFEKMINAWIMAIHGTIPPSLSGELVQPLRFLERNLSVLLEPAEVSAEPASEIQRTFLDLLLEKRRRDAADFVVSLVKRGDRPDQLCRDLLTPALRQIGLLWQENRISAADEHAAAEICRYIIFRLCDSIPRKQPLPYRALVSCVPGEEHQLGAEIVASHLESEGWTVYFVGHSAPEQDNVAAIDKHKPDAVFLTVTLVSNLPATVELSQKIRQTAPQVKIILGGRAAAGAQQAIGKFADAIIEDYRTAHLTAIRFLGEDA
jgi:methanogenic corrinoid protein MtbC1